MAGALHPEGPDHDLGVGGHERENGRRAEEVRRHEEIDVEDVRVDVLGVLEHASAAYGSGA